jgi:hypothetical protein
VTTHVGIMVIFAAFVAVVFAVLSRDEPRDQMVLGVRMFAGFVAAGLFIGWLLYPLPF